MDAYGLPGELANLQALDMSKIGFAQDLTRGLKKVLGADKSAEENPAAAAAITLPQSAYVAGAEPLLKRAFIFLKDGDFKKADEYCEKVLDMDPENARAYVGKLLAELELTAEEQLPAHDDPLDEYKNFHKALQFADEHYRDMLQGYNQGIHDRLQERRENIYLSAVADMTYATSVSEFRAAADKFASIPGYKDATVLAQQCHVKAVHRQQADEEAEVKLSKLALTITVAVVFVIICVLYNYR
jgi:tetratricopeptide (TPR) repeat protein